ncbi:MAG: acetyl-CoA carboxylase biotin carboxylase subunit, partial [Deltaproteobacteria bacterium]|nr:acetyl-CoA carboxylase biotin carboxylase subunit [Deltaproteobacteria bacterium]
ASAEARGAFGDPRLYLEKLIEGGRHVEIQVMADRYGHAIHIGERDCTVQRNHQKLIEESPSPSLTDEMREQTCIAAAAAAARIGYVGAGTFEFLLDEGGVLRFMEMNTRLQVEHTVSEIRSGLDLVAMQIRVAAGQPLGVKQSEVELDGHAIELRINAEDPSDGFRPSPGTISTWQPPEVSPGVRVDTHVETGYTVPPHYDSLLCKLIVKAGNRDQAIAATLEALEGFEVRGVETTIPMHQSILASADFKTSNYDTRTIPGWSAEES